VVVVFRAATGLCLLMRDLCDVFSVLVNSFGL
jgi:hypothetical protein